MNNFNKQILSKILLVEEVVVVVVVIVVRVLVVLTLPTYTPFRVVKDTIGAIAESEKEVEYAAREMEYIIR